MRISPLRSAIDLEKCRTIGGRMMPMVTGKIKARPPMGEPIFDSVSGKGGRLDGAHENVYFQMQIPFTIVTNPVGLMRSWHLVLILFLVVGCQSRHLLDEIIRPNSTLTFEKLDGPRGDVVLSIASNAEGVLFAGTRGNGVLRSTDGGDSWEQTALQEGTIWPLYTAPGGSIIAFVHGNRGGRGIARSTDAGDSWTVLPDSVEKFFGNAVVRIWGRYIYSEGGGGLHRSMDDGLTWETLNSDPFAGGMRGEYDSN